MSFKRRDGYYFHEVPGIVVNANLGARGRRRGRGKARRDETQKC